MPNVLLSPWKGGTPRRLCNALGLYLRTPDQFRAHPLARVGTLVNWGNYARDIESRRVLNAPQAVASACSKLMTFRILSDAKIPTLEYTTDRNLATGWTEVASVFAHINPHAHSAQGLELIRKGADKSTVPAAKVYTKYFPKSVESRTHVIREKDGSFRHLYLEKRRVSKERYDEFDLEESPTTFIRTWANGWIFAREVMEDSQAIDLAIKTLALFKLDYG